MYIEAVALDRRMIEIQPGTKVVSILFSRFIHAVKVHSHHQHYPWSTISLLLPTLFPVLGSFICRWLSYLVSNLSLKFEALFSHQHFLKSLVLSSTFSLDNFVRSPHTFLLLAIFLLPSNISLLLNVLLSSRFFTVTCKAISRS